MNSKLIKFLVFFILVILIFNFGLLRKKQLKATIDNYPDIILTGGFQSGNFNKIYDLTKYDMLISFTYDATGLRDFSGAHAWSEFGIRAIGYGNFNPTWQSEGAGIWIATDYDWTTGTFAPDPLESPTLDLDDKIILQKGGGWGEDKYNLPTSPVTPSINYGIWFDRDGVDQWQAGYWGSVNGGTYNTYGLYNIQLYIHATSANFGTAYLKINGVSQGFYNNTWKNAQPDIYPAGMTFTGDMTKMQIFYGLYGYGALHTVKFNNIKVILNDEVWVDDDWAVSTPGQEVAPGKFFGFNAFAKIQDGINGVANLGTVHVYPGNYQEQLVINKNINLEGIVENGNKPIIKPPNTVSKFKFPESSAWWEPVIIAFGGSVDGSGNISGTGIVDVSIKNFEIDGNNRQPSSNTRSAGILVRNVKSNNTNTSTISNNVIKNMYIDSAQTFGIIVYGDSDLVIEYNNVSGYSKNGITANGDSITSDPQYPTPHAIIQYNTVTGPGMGIQVTYAPNGIQIGWGAIGKILNNNVSGNGWPGTDWTGSGIIVAGADNVEIAYNDVSGNETGIAVCGWMWNQNGVTADNTNIHENNVLNNSYGISIQDKSNNTTIDKNTIKNNKYDGIDICNFYGFYPKNTIIKNNDISNNNTENDNTCGGIWIYEGIPSNEISINYNIISGNNNYGILNTSTTYVVNTKYNWWGDESGPSGVGPGSGDAVTSNVDYSPWLVPNISVTKSDSPDPVAQGMPLTYTLNWSMGTNWATWDGTTVGTTTVPVPTGLTFGNVILKDTLPSQVTYVSCTGGGVYSSGVVTWNLGNYNPGTSGSVTVNVNVNLNAPDGVITNNVEISYDTLKITDSEDTTIQEGAGGVYNFFDSRTDAYILLNIGSSRWRVIIPSRNYDTGWMSFSRYTSLSNRFWGEYTDARYHFIIDFTYPNRYHIIFNDRLTRISIKIAN